MTTRRSGSWSARLLGVALTVLATRSARAEDCPSLSLEAAIVWALQNNPELTAVRQQHGVAAAGVVIAQTYPFNPVNESKIRAANGPESAGITNRVSVESRLAIDIEMYGQGRYRRQGACATLSRTDWEIAAREIDVSVRVLRAFDALVYRGAKMRLAREIVQTTEQAAEQVRKLAAGGLLRPADLIVAQTEVDDVFAQLAPARSAEVTASQELRKALGLTVDGSFALADDLEIEPVLPAAPPELIEEALQRRPDLHARSAAVAEAEARLKLEKANRYGNPNGGPAYEYDPTRINLIGAQFTLPLPVFNTHRGEILQREAELARAAAEVRQAEVQVTQEVQAALARLGTAHAWAETYRQRVLPNLRTSLQNVQRLFEQNDPGADVVRVLDIRRKLLRARDAYLDALWEVRQARADLAAALGDPSLVAPSLRAAPCVPAH